MIHPHHLRPAFFLSLIATNYPPFREDSLDLPYVLFDLWALSGPVQALLSIFLKDDSFSLTFPPMFCMVYHPRSDTQGEATNGINIMPN